MENDHNISDELLAKYLSGSTTPEETEQVLAYLAADDENIEDFSKICEAVKCQHDSERSVHQRRLRRRILWIGSSVAAAVAVIFICLFALKMGGDGNNANLLADANDSIRKSSGNTSTISSDSLENSRVKPSNGTGKDVLDSRIPVQKEVPAPTYADGMNRAHFARMIYPFKDVQYVTVGRKSVGFKWDSDAVKVRLTIRDDVSDEKLLLDEWISGSDHFNWSLPPIEDHVFSWKMIFVFEDGTTVIRQGQLQDENLIID